MNVKLDNEGILTQAEVENIKVGGRVGNAVDTSVGRHPPYRHSGQIGGKGLPPYNLFARDEAHRNPKLNGFSPPSARQ